MAKLERIFLWVMVVALALVVGWFAFTESCPKTSCEPTDTSSESLEPKLDSILALLGDVDASAKAIQEELEGLPASVADAVYQRFRQEGLCRLVESCDTGPTTPDALVDGDYTLHFENAKLDDAKKLTENNVGVFLAPRHKRRLDRLINAFGACQWEGSKQVEFRVVGYSSTAGFRARTPAGDHTLENSDQLNVAAANLRAKIVADYLKREGRFQAEPKEWDSYDAMSRPYLDDSGPADQQALNRSVFIQVCHAGECDLGKPRPQECK